MVGVMVLMPVVVMVMMMITMGSLMVTIRLFTLAMCLGTVLVAHWYLHICLF
jgi:hypothetical protein